jgi:GDSL-like Lipase/Acylhydrolase
MHSNRSQIIILFLLVLVALAISPARAGFSSIYAFGDGICTTDTNNTTQTQLYHGKRYCNGRVWIEVLSQWQGVAYQVSKNKSFFGHDSVKLINSVNAFVAPVDAATSLFIVWANNADFVEFINTAGNEPPYTANTPLGPWNSFINSAVSRHTQAITTLYNKGARVVVMPKAVNISSTPLYNLDEVTNTFLKNRVIQFNTAFDTAMIALAASKAGLVIHRPDTFTFLEQVLANSSAYGLIHPTGTNGAVFDFPNPSLATGTATNYVFWDDLNPTAKFQMQLADLVQQMISPAKVQSITSITSNVQITVANVPLGRAGVVEGCAALVPPWQTDAAINVPFSVGGSTTTAVTFPTAGTARFYRVGFPVAWTWP